MRLDIHLETEIINEKIQESSRELLQRISSIYFRIFAKDSNLMAVKLMIEIDIVKAVQNDNLISKMEQFDSKCRSYLTQSSLTDIGIEAVNKLMLEIHQEADKEIERLSDHIFDHKSCYFQKKSSGLNILDDIEISRNWRHKLDATPLQNTLQGHLDEVFSLGVLQGGSKKKIMAAQLDLTTLPAM